MTSRGRNPAIVMTSPPNTSGASNHPRRPPAKHSVSLLHHAVQSSGPERAISNGEPGDIDPPSSLQALRGKGSSGESSNAEKWFEKSNNEVKENSASFADNDPPFFMRNSSSSETPPDLRQRMRSVTNGDIATSLPLHASLLQLGTDGSGTEDFRGVIDDLTVENKKLKRRLKKYERLHDSHLRDEKLFELRIHGLPAEKKRELEDTLRKFASTLTPNSDSAFPTDGYASLMPTLKKGKTASSQASLRNADSAYASMSASGRGSSAQSGKDANHRMTPSQYPAVRRQNVQNYLHHIPEGLLPQHNPATMTERARKKLVVRRMEQIFAGKGAAAGGSQQPLQQQEVSQSAAKTERSALEASGQRTQQEGSREAHIMVRGTEDPVDGVRKTSSLDDEQDAEQQVEEGNDTRQDFADQRPTRPLDLDPHRAQVPEENIRYLRQMGFSPLESGSAASLEDGHGWIYLNFLINMAQLHIINVTTDFVRKALSEHSRKLEVSRDGRRVRWRGGKSGSKPSSTGEGSSYDHTNNNPPDAQSPRKRVKLSQDGSKIERVGGTSQRLQSEQSKFAYTPLFFHRDDSDQTDDSSSSEEEEERIPQPFPAHYTGNSLGMTSSDIPFASTKKSKKADDGPIIFYNTARFCTDLSGECTSPGNYNVPVYTTASNIPIGKQRIKEDAVAERPGLLAEFSELSEPMDLGDNPIPEAMELSFPDRSPPRPYSPKEQEPIDLEASGIGGVWPADNFSLSVESRQALIDQQRMSDTCAIVASKSRPSRLAQVFRNSNCTPIVPLRVENHVLASKLLDLPPSELPPALSFMPFGEASEGDEESDDEDLESEALESPGVFPPSAAPQPVDLPYASSEDEEDDDDDDEYDSDEEVDFLAAEREIDPEAVRQKEREYDSYYAERLAEEIPAGSSAATAGGGSGFASPGEGTSRDEYRQAIKAARDKTVGSKHPGSTSSMMVNHMNDISSDSEDEYEDDMSDGAMS